MSQDRMAEDRVMLAVGQPVRVVTQWLERHGITRYAFLMSPDQVKTHRALIYQESYRSPPVLVMPGDVLAARDLGGTSGALTVLHLGPPLPEEGTPS